MDNNLSIEQQDLRRALVGEIRAAVGSGVTAPQVSEVLLRILCSLPEAGGSSQNFLFQFWLRENLKVCAVLPQGITALEAQRLGAAIKTIVPAQEKQVLAIPDEDLERTPVFTEDGGPRRAVVQIGACIKPSARARTLEVLLKAFGGTPALDAGVTTAFSEGVSLRDSTAKQG